MDRHSRPDIKRLLKREDGAVAVEFVILFPLFLLIIVGIVEFGHLFYVRHTLTNASREGARAAVVYVSNYDPYATRKEWAEATAKDKVDKYLADTKFGAGSYEITFPSSGSTTSDPFTVTITAENVTLVMELLISKFLNDPITVTAETTMRME